MSKNIEKIWLKAITTGIIFEIRKVEKPIYSPLKYVEATKEEVEAYKKGEYWKKESSKKKDN